MKASSARQSICRNVKDEEKEGFIDGSISTLALFINENVSVEFEGAHAFCQYSNIDYKPKKHIGTFLLIHIYQNIETCR